MTANREAIADVANPLGLDGIEYIEYDAQNDRQRAQEMLDYSGGDITVPTLVVDGEYLQSGWGDPPRG